MTINFMLLWSPLLATRDPNTIIVSQEFSTSPSLPEILWNFSRYEGRARITLEQNPHFYLRCPADESAYTPMFRRHPLQDPSGALEHNDTVYVLFDGPGRVFFHNKRNPRIFANVWSLNGSLIFRDCSGVLEGEQLVRGSSIRGNLWYYEQQVVSCDSNTRSRLNHHCLRPMMTTSRSINIHIYDPRGSPGSRNSLDSPPSPPTSERPGYHVSYTAINTLDDDILLGIFSYYRLDEDNAWNDRLGWCKLSHVCRRWRHIVYSSASHLGMHILCTNGTPIVDTLDHLPTLPLFVVYRDPITQQDKLAGLRALLMWDRVRHIDLHLPPSNLNMFLMLMDEPLSMLEYLSLSSPTEGTSLVLPKSFLAPNLRYLTLLGIDLPKRLRLLSSTVSLVTLVLRNIRASGYFLPKLLVARLRSLPQLEELSIGFSIPIPRPSAERELFGNQGTPVTLPNLKYLKFKGVSVYLESLVAQIRTPLLERLDITLFNQLAFGLPHLSHFTNITEGLKLPIAKVSFERDAVTIITRHHGTREHNGRFALRVMCGQLDWQIDCAAQICCALLPVSFGVEKLKLKFYEQVMPTEWQNGEIDDTTWHELLRAFIRVKELHLCPALSQELSRALQVDVVGFDLGLLPSLRKIVSEFKGRHSHNLFSSFAHARQIATHRPDEMQREKMIWHTR
ncbi:hypothetical protein H4582DRAFT_2142090 [Lactarius indigo]|nr:hypothetical protein H4582DRAFT_2142090 [Lactarius indigo]